MTETDLKDGYKIIPNAVGLKLYEDITNLRDKIEVYGEVSYKHYTGDGVVYYCGGEAYGDYKVAGVIMEEPAD